MRMFVDFIYFQYTYMYNTLRTENILKTITEYSINFCFKLILVPNNRLIT